MKPLRIDEIPWDKIPEKKRKVFVRVDYNVPLEGEKVLDDYRIRQSLPTIRYLLEQKAVVVLASHLGRPEKLSHEKRKSLSLLPIAERLAELLDHDVLFSEEVTGSGIRKLIIDGRGGKTIILRENLRFDSGEEKNDPVFAQKLFEECEVYVDDAFGAAHRAHASIHAVAQLARIKSMGLLLAREWEVLNSVLYEPVKPQVAVMGGAKIEDKIQIIEKLMPQCSDLFFGGRMGLIFLAAQDMDVGQSNIDKNSIQVAKRVMADAKSKGVRLHFPTDGRAAANRDQEQAELVKLGRDQRLPAGLSVFDVGPATIEAWRPFLSKAKTVVWNGPMGVFEKKPFSEGTYAMVDFLVEHRETIRAVTGGGETVAAIGNRDALSQLFHVSTGGGAMLEFLEGQELPGFEVLKLREREVQGIQNYLASIQQ
jgi:phosphoglycerate kinase